MSRKIRRERRQANKIACSVERTLLRKAEHESMELFMDPVEREYGAALARTMRIFQLQPVTVKTYRLAEFLRDVSKKQA